MRKTLVIVLIIAVIPLYLWDGLLVARFFFGKEQEELTAASPAAMTAEFSLRAGRSVRFVEKGKDPFLPMSPKKAPAAPAIKPTAAKTAAQQPQKPEMPAITINSIMWSPASPVAIVNLPGGSTAVVKIGQTVLDGVVVKKIEKGQVTFGYRGKSFVVKKQ